MFSLFARSLDNVDVSESKCGRNRSNQMITRLSRSPLSARFIAARSLHVLMTYPWAAALCRPKSFRFNANNQIFELSKLRSLKVIILHIQINEISKQDSNLFAER